MPGTNDDGLDPLTELLLERRPSLLHNNELRPYLREQAAVVEAANAMVPDPSERGRHLAAVLSALLARPDAYAMAGVRTWAGDPFPEAVRLLFVAAGTNPATAEAFVASAPLDQLPTDALALSLDRAFGYAGRDARAILALADGSGIQLDPMRRSSLMRAAHASAPRTTQDASRPSASPTIPEGALERWAAAQLETAEREAAARQVLEHRHALIQEAKAAVDALYDAKTPEALQELQRATQEVERFDPASGQAIFIDGLRAASEDPGSLVAPLAARRLELELLRLANGDPSSISGASTEGSQALQRSLRRIIESRVAGATTVADDRVVVDEAALEHIGDLAASLSVAFDPQDARRTVVELIPRRQRRLDAQLLVGDALGGLPESVLDVQVVYGESWLTYPCTDDAESEQGDGVPSAPERHSPVDALIDDIRDHFLLGGRHPDEVDDDVGRALNPRNHDLARRIADHDTIELFDSLADELREWYASGSTEPFRHSWDEGGMPYKFSGSTFIGNRFRVERQADGSLRFTITGGVGYGADPDHPSAKLLSFAASANRTDDVEHQAPRLRFQLAPSPRRLRMLSEASPNAFTDPILRSESRSEGTATRRVAVREVVGCCFDELPIAGVVEAAQRLIAPAIPSIVPHIDATEAERVCEAVEVGRAASRSVFTLSTNLGPLSLEVQRNVGDDHVSGVRGDGIVLVPLYVRWRQEDDDAPQLKVDAITVEVALPLSDDALRPALQRAAALEILRTPPEPGAPLRSAGGWTHDHDDVILPCDALPEDLARAVTERLSNAQRPDRHGWSRHLPEIRDDGPDGGTPAAPGRPPSDLGPGDAAPVRTAAPPGTHGRRRAAPGMLTGDPSPEQPPSGTTGSPQQGSTRRLGRPSRGTGGHFSAHL